MPLFRTAALTKYSFLLPLCTECANENLFFHPYASPDSNRFHDRRFSTEERFLVLVGCLGGSRTFVMLIEVVVAVELNRSSN